MLTAGVGQGMLRLFPVIFSLFLALLLSACNLDAFKSVDDLKSDARQALNAKNFSEAGNVAQRLTEKAPTDYEGQFILAQAKAQTGDKNAALTALESAIKLGLKDDEQIDKCANLEPIKSMTAYHDLMSASFPSRVSVDKPGKISAGDGVSIQTGDEKQLIRAGDVVIEVPVVK